MNNNSKTIVIRSDVLIDGVSREPLKDAGILIEKDKITRVAQWDKGGPWPEGEDVLQLRTKALIPGLINIHVHVTSKEDLNDYLNNGITSIRDMGDWGIQKLMSTSALHLKKDIEEGRIAGPRLFTYGSMIDGPVCLYPELSVAVINEKEAKAVVDQQAAEGADGIKIYCNLIPKLAKAVIAHAKENNLPTAGHIGLFIGGVEGAQMGIDSIEHTVSFGRDFIPFFIRPAVYSLLRLGYKAEPSKALIMAAKVANTFDPDNEKFKRMADDFLKTGAVFNPTLYVIERGFKYGVLVKENNPRYLKSIENPLLEKVYSYCIPAKWDKKIEGLCQIGFQSTLQFVNFLYRSGIPMGVGTDDGAPFVFPGGSLHEELSLLVQAGIPPLEVIRMATSRNAKTLRRNDLGVISEGKTADVVLLNRNPAEDISATREIAHVIKGGRIVFSRT